MVCGLEAPRRCGPPAVPTAPRQGSLGALSPRLTLHAHVRDDVTVFGAFGRGVRPPEARAFSSITPRAHRRPFEDVYTGGGPAHAFGLRGAGYPMESEWLTAGVRAVHFVAGAPFNARASVTALL